MAGGMGQLMERRGVEGILTLERAGRGQMDLILHGRVVGLIAAVGQNLHAHTGAELSDQLIGGDVAFLHRRQLRHSLNVAGVEHRRIVGGQLELRLTAPVPELLLVLLPGQGLFVLEVVGIPVFHIGGLGAFLQVPVLLGVVFAVLIHDLHHGHPAGIVIALHHGNEAQPEGVAASVTGLGDAVLGRTAAAAAPLLLPFQPLFLQHMGKGIGQLCTVFVLILRSAHRLLPPIPPG